MLYLPYVCVCVDHCLFIQVWSIFYMDSLHASPFCDFISKVVLLYCIYIIHYSFFSSKFLYQLLLPVTMMLETWYVTYGWGQDNILYLYSHNHIRCFAISRKNITMFIKSFPCFGKGEQYIPVTHKIHVHFAIAGLSFSEQP